MGIIDSFLIKSTISGNTRSVRLALTLHSIKNSFEKLFSKINLFRNRESFNANGNHILNQALERSVRNLDHNVMTLLIGAGADVKKIEKNSIGSVIYKYERALAHEKEVMPIFGKEHFRGYKEKCCLILGELVVNGAMPRNTAEKAKILDIFKEREGFNEFKKVAKLKFEVNSVSNMIPPKKPPRTFEYKPTTIYTDNVLPPKKPPRIFKYKPKYDALLSKEPIYAKVYDAKISNSLEELSISDYAEIYDPQKGSTENLSLEDSGYSSISGEPIYEDVDNFSEQKKPTSLNHKEQSEPIYAKVDLFKKRAERKIKDIKANSGTYHGLVQDKVNNLQVKLNEQSANKRANQQIKTKAGSNVKEIRQKFERRDSGHDSGYDSSNTKVEEKLELAPKSEIGSVNIEHGVIEGCRYKTTDISL